MRKFLILCAVFLSAHLRMLGQEASIEVTGTITEAQTGVPIPGANILEKGTSNGVTTDFDGNYTIQVPVNAVLEVSYIGFKSMQIPVNGQIRHNVILNYEASALEEVVVVGYGTQRKKDLTGSVSVVKTDDFKQQPITRVDEILQGRASGVQVTQAGGAPGGESRVRIRGANSVLGNNDPLYVIDGYVGADFNMVNPSDIESLQVLKDAASTSVYGSRGANGVVIITTKDGTKGAIKVTYQGNFSVSEVIKQWDVLDAYDFATVVNERSDALGISPVFTTDEIAGFRANGGTDWQDVIFRTAWGKEHKINVSGGGDKTSYMVSGNYMEKDGILENSDFKRYGIRSNINSEVNDNLTIGVNITGTRLENHNTGLLRGAGNPVVQALAWAPTTPVYNENGGYILSDPVGSFTYSPAALLYERANDNQRNIINIIGNINYKLPVEGLSLDLKYAVNYVNAQGQSFVGNAVSQNNPSAHRSSSEQIILQGTNALNYSRTFNDVHKINAVAVFETQQFTNNSFSSTGNTLLFPSLGYYNLPLAESYAVGSGYTKWSLLSYLGRFNYTYKDRLLLSAAVRRDGSSKFAENNRFSTFPSVAVGYVLSEEDFIQNLNVFDHLKLRASWGKTGSQAINPYATLNAYNNNTPMAFNSGGVTSGIQIGNPGNPNLKWETTSQIDIGLEMQFFNRRLSLEVDYFQKSTEDLLLNQALPSYVGGGIQTKNVGEIENKGFEFALIADVIDSESFNWSSHLNISTVKNEVVSLGGIAPRIPQGTHVGGGLSTTNEFMLMPGESLASYWGLNYLGTWKPGEEAEANRYNAVPGDSRYKDLNDDGTITTDDFQIIGKGIPTTTAGWNNTFTYNNLSLNVFFQGVFGIDKLNYTRGAAMTGSGDARQFILSNIKDRYIPGENETSDIPAFSSSNVMYTQSSRFIEKGDYIRLKNVSLAYEFPKSVFENTQLQLSLSATNLFTITDYSGIDPESSNIGSGTDTAQGIDYGAYPNSKTYTIGLNLTF
ncbi:SusC/RagA family TonB-linked outer membrane protein [Galbibacter sp.]|uniref:SusC/RagA family TonB-linked outer membrane protein n=1 Tax=Galbibacter sp. TaxID=2918471 RepID=UPI003A8D9390